MRRHGTWRRPAPPKAVALADDVPELVTELRQRATRARNLEVRIFSS